MLHWRPTKPDSLVMGSRQVVLRSTALMESSTFMQHANICLWFLILDQHLPHPWGTHWNISWQKCSNAETELYHNLIAACQYFWGHVGEMPLSVLVFRSRLGGWQPKRANNKKKEQPGDMKLVRLHRWLVHCVKCSDTLVQIFTFTFLPWGLCSHLSTKWPLTFFQREKGTW